MFDVYCVSCVTPNHYYFGITKNRQSRFKQGWVNPARNAELMYGAVKAGRSYGDALKDTAPTMQRELQMDFYECAAWQDKETKIATWPMVEACMRARGWVLVSSPKEMAEAYARAWRVEVDRHEGIDPRGL
jgi:predicted GIY-YIG superfamily endonuclease